jgi:hypothetical protein
VEAPRVAGIPARVDLVGVALVSVGLFGAVFSSSGGYASGADSVSGLAPAIWVVGAPG